MVTIDDVLSIFPGAKVILPADVDSQFPPPPATNSPILLKRVKRASEASQARSVAYRKGQVERKRRSRSCREQFQQGHFWTDE